MKELNLTNVEPEKGFGGPEPGGYVLKIINVEDVPGKEYLKIDYDFADGEYANHYLSLFDKFGFWGGTMYKSYKEKSLGWFKAFISDVEASNSGYKWDNDEKKLEGKLFGAVLGSEEYRSNDGEIKESLKVKKTLPVQDIRDGKFKIPKLKKLEESNTSNEVVDASAQIIDTDDIPF